MSSPFSGVQPFARARKKIACRESAFPTHLSKHQRAQENPARFSILFNSASGRKSKIATRSGLTAKPRPESADREESLPAAIPTIKVKLRIAAQQTPEVSSIDRRLRYVNLQSNAGKALASHSFTKMRRCCGLFVNFTT